MNYSTQKPYVKNFYLGKAVGEIVALIYVVNFLTSIQHKTIQLTKIRIYKKPFKIELKIAGLLRGYIFVKPVVDMVKSLHRELP